VNLLIIISVNRTKDICIAAYVANESEAQIKKKKAEETTASGAAGETENLSDDDTFSPLTSFPEEL